MALKTTQESSRKIEGSYDIPTLPLSVDLESKAIIKKLHEASRALAELKGFVQTMPNQDILINTLPLQEAKDSSAIESIHPFFDGNGRTGRIINILYLVLRGLLDKPILYLSRYISQNKPDYYRLLQTVRQNDTAWEEWILFMLEGVRQTSRHTINLVSDITKLMLSQKNTIRKELPKIYSQDLLNNLFIHPYTKIAFLEEKLEVTRLTATKYLNELVRIGILTKHKIGRENFYLNDALCGRLINVGEHPLIKVVK